MGEGDGKVYGVIQDAQKRCVFLSIENEFFVFHREKIENILYNMFLPLSTVHYISSTICFVFILLKCEMLVQTFCALYHYYFFAPCICAVYTLFLRPEIQCNILYFKCCFFVVLKFKFCFSKHFAQHIRIRICCAKCFEKQNLNFKTTKKQHLKYKMLH